VAQVLRTGSTNTVQYLHRDHQGSVVEVTNSSGTLVQSLAFDAWGLRRNPANWLALASPFGGTQPTERGYTGHEHLDHVELVHMNGRVQDPKLGRFLSADPFVQAPYRSQSLDRYAYAWNNPASLVDPSGFQTSPCTEDMSGIDCDTAIAMSPDYHSYPRVIFGSDLAAIDRLIRSNIENPPFGGSAHGASTPVVSATGVAVQVGREGVLPRPWSWPAGEAVKKGGNTLWNPRHPGRWRNPGCRHTESTG
jgi:RHS repeat-associated protein